MSGPYYPSGMCDYRFNGWGCKYNGYCKYKTSLGGCNM